MDQPNFISSVTPTGGQMDQMDAKLPTSVPRCGGIGISSDTNTVSIPPNSGIII